MSFIARLVESGTLGPGSPLPSLRQISREHGTSLATARHVCRLLEDRGVLEANARSGLYVARGTQTRFRSGGDLEATAGTARGAIARLPGT